MKKATQMLNYRGFVCTSSGIGAGDGGSNRNKISYKFFKDCLLLRHSAAAAWISSSPSNSNSTNFIEPVPVGSTAEIASSDDQNSLRITTQRPARESVRTDLAFAVAAERQQREEEREVVASPAGFPFIEDIFKCFDNAFNFLLAIHYLKSPNCRWFGLECFRS